MRRWAATPMYGAILAPVFLLVRSLGLWLLAGVGLGAAGAVVARRLWR